ncbi:AraC family transcriptional regulator [Vibrio hangzhouensis]|uniref:AraC family transcriptional regulator n=1 Tax=Vibrio hangzhouensis TaxID=462991 RepID=UPI001C97DD24|nr:AraC family transcriptional regulator [Vibrio hangzhouensis]MBY6197356.1 AraC family transcriptional regulator [Vibrio hangzhouensis]
MAESQRAIAIVERPDQVPLSYLVNTQSVLDEHGYDISKILLSRNITEQVMADPNFKLSVEEYYSILEQVLKTAAIPALGIKVGKKFSLGDYGVLGYAFISSKSFDQALQLFFRYQAIIGGEAMSKEVLHYDGSEVFITVSCSSICTETQRFEVEESFGQWLAMSDIMKMNGISLQFSRIEFTFPKPDNFSNYQQEIPCPVYFEQSKNAIYFNKSDLEQRFSMADQVTSQLCSQQCEVILNNLKSCDALITSIRRMIINQPNENLSLEDVARFLNLSPRTLRRRLKDNSTSFGDIKSEIRMEVAREYLLNTKISTQEIAHLVGYSDVANFYRAFKKYQGVTPGDFRLNESAKYTS